MDSNRDVQLLIDDLEFVKKAISKNSNILKLIDAAGIMSRVLFASGLVTIFLSGAAYLLILHYGSFQQIPWAFRGGMFLMIAALVVVTAILKVRSIMVHVNKGSSNITVQRLIQDIYTPQALHISIPFIMTMILQSIFLVSNDLLIYLVPVLSILTGLLSLAYVNVFHTKELIITGDWMLATGLLTLFFVHSIHPLMAIILTFGIGFCTVLPANRYLERQK